jgi:hypothetical protein
LAGDALEPALPHQAGDPLAADTDLVLVAQLVVNPHRAVGLVRAIMDRHDQPGELGIAQ